MRVGVLACWRVGVAPCLDGQWAHERTALLSDAEAQREALALEVELARGDAASAARAADAERMRTREHAEHMRAAGRHCVGHVGRVGRVVRGLWLSLVGGESMRRSVPLPDYQAGA